MSDFFPVINPAPPGMNEEHPGQEAWLNRQLRMYETSVRLYQKNLVCVVHPADGSRPDLVEVTDDGLTALGQPPDDHAPPAHH
jgi:hypothetical protein